MKVIRIIVPLLIAAGLLGGLLLNSVLPGLAATSAANPVGPTGSTWSMTFNDEFDGTTLNRNVWRSDYFPNGGNGEAQQYVADNSHNNYVVQNGVLSIVARKETLNGQPYTSGIIHTKDRFQQKYGFFEIRARIPNGKGYWPAFWLLPNQDNWVPEVDITEILAGQPNLTYMTYHYYNSTGAYVQTQSSYTGPDFSSGFHTFGVDWEPDAMVFYVDGVERKRDTDTSTFPSMPLYVIANLAVGGNWPGYPDSSTVFPASYDIDYIRVWQKTGATSNTPVPTSPAPTATPVTTQNNLLVNGSFDSSIGTGWASGWNFRNDLGATFSQDTSTVATTSSTASMKTVLPSANTTQPWVVASSQANKSLAAGKLYTLSFWAKASAARPIRAVVQMQNSPYTEYTSQAANLGTGWARYSFNFTPASSTTAAMVNFNLADATGTVWLDEVCLSSAGQTPTSTPTTIYLPTVTATSAPTLAPTATQALLTMPNMVVDGSFEAVIGTGWNNNWNLRNDLGATFSQDTSTVATGSKASLKTVLPKSSSTQPWVVAVSQANKSLTAGQSYTLSFWAKASAARSIRAVMQLQNSPYTELTNQAANLGTGWTRYSFNFTPSGSTTAAMVNFNLAGATGTVWLDGVSLCKTGYTCN